MIPNSLFLEEHVRKKCLYLKYLCKNKSSARRFLSYVHLHVLVTSKNLYVDSVNHTRWCVS